MSTPTPRTDAVYAKWQEGWDRTPFGPDLARTLERELADQAARFHDELARRQETVRANNKLNKKELDQLRAEVERLTAQRENLHKPMRDQAIARAERAEAELADHKTALEIANRSADEQMRYKREAEAELATERARLDWLEQRGPWESWNVPCGEAEITLRGPIRAAIDAAMMEGAK